MLKYRKNAENSIITRKFNLLVTFKAEERDEYTMKRKYEVRIHYNDDPSAIEKAAQLIAQAIKEGKIKLDDSDIIPNQETA